MDRNKLVIAVLFLTVTSVFGQNAGTYNAPAGNSSTGSVTSVTIAGTTNQIVVTGTCTGTTTISCTLSIPSGLVLPGTIDGLTITTTTGTLTITGAKVLTVNKSLTLDGTDGVTLTFPATSATIARTDAGQTFTGVQAFSSSPTMPTVSQADNSTKGATTAYVDAGLASVAQTANQKLRQSAVTFTGNGSALAGTSVDCHTFTISGVIQGVNTLADVSGSATIGFRSVVFASYTGIAGYSGYTDIIGIGTSPSLSSAITANPSLASWTTTITATPASPLVMCMQVSSPSTIINVKVNMTYAAN